MRHGLILLGLAIFFNAFANILIKIGMIQVGHTENVISMVKKMLNQPILYFGVLSFAMALILYSMVLTKLNLSIAYPIMVSMGLIIVVLVSYFLLREVIHPIQFVGFLLIIVGVWMVAR